MSISRDIKQFNFEQVTHHRSNLASSREEEDVFDSRMCSTTNTTYYIHAPKSLVGPIWSFSWVVQGIARRMIPNSEWFGPRTTNTSLVDGTLSSRQHRRRTVLRSAAIFKITKLQESVRFFEIMYNKCVNTLISLPPQISWSTMKRCLSTSKCFLVAVPTYEL